MSLQDLGSDKEVTQPIPMTSGDLVWASDNRHLLYTVKDELDRPYKVLLHAVGANKTDTVVFEERDEVSSSSYSCCSDSGSFSCHQHSKEGNEWIGSCCMHLRGQWPGNIRCCCVVMRGNHADGAVVLRSEMRRAAGAVSQQVFASSL